MRVTAVHTAGTFLSALCALMLIGCGSSDDASNGDGLTPVARRAEHDPTLVCQRSKLRALGYLEFCLSLNRADVLAGKPDKALYCRSDFDTAIGRIDDVASKQGTSCRYIDNGDDTVSDLDTGLMWEKKAGTVGGRNTGRIDDVNNRYTWSAAFTSFLAGFDRVGIVGRKIFGCFANHCDWRLPTFEELKGILDTGAATCRTGPHGLCIDPIFGPTQSDVYWSVTASTFPGISFPNPKWGVLFRSGNGFIDDKTSSHYVRAVRRGFSMDE